MGFRIVSPVNAHQLVWAQVDVGAGPAGDTLYEGQLVKKGSAGVKPLGAASGASDSSNKGVPIGVVVGTNNRTPVFNSTYKGHSITAQVTQATLLARDWFGAEGQYPKGDPQAMVRIALIDHTTLLEGPIWNAAYGTAISAKTNTTQSTDGSTVTLATAGSADFTPVAGLATIHCRTGSNMGLQRITYNTSKTSITTYSYFPYDIEVNDTFVYVPMRDLGTSYVQFDSESTYIEGGSSASLATNYYILDIVRLYLAESGKERAVFRFNADQFCQARA